MSRPVTGAGVSRVKIRRMSQGAGLIGVNLGFISPELDRSILMLTGLENETG